MSIVPPLLTFFLFIAGLLVWRLQLLNKRQFEVAEQALTVAARAGDALTRIRQIFITRAELHATQVEDVAGAEEAIKAQRRMRAIRQRVASEGTIFAEVRVTQILCELYLSREVVVALQVLIHASREVLIATDAYMFCYPVPSVPLNDEELKATNSRIRECENIFWECRGPDRLPIPEDKLSARIDDALSALTAGCKPYLRLNFLGVHLTKMKNLVPLREPTPPLT